MGTKLEKLMRLIYRSKYHMPLIIKPTFDSRTTFDDIVATLTALKYAMDELQMKSISISRIGNGFNQISWPMIETEIRKIFGQGDYVITICYGDVETPPETDQERLIREYHCSATGGHKGSNKIYEKIRENFYWTNMREQVREFVPNCKDCKLNKAVRIKTKLPMKITDTPSEAFAKVEMDIVGPLPETESGNKYILTIQDNLTPMRFLCEARNPQLSPRYLQSILLLDLGVHRSFTPIKVVILLAK